MKIAIQPEFKTDAYEYFRLELDCGVSKLSHLMVSYEITTELMQSLRVVLAQMESMQHED